MTKSFRTQSTAIFIASVVAVLLTLPALKAQTNADAALVQKYEKILGRYALDLSSMGGDLKEVVMVVREGRLWIDDGDGRPAEMKPENDSGLEFAGVDAVNGPIKLTFIKDDTGAVVKCRCLMPDLNLDVTGKKLK